MLGVAFINSIRQRPIRCGVAVAVAGRWISHGAMSWHMLKKWAADLSDWCMKYLGNVNYHTWQKNINQKSQVSTFFLFFWSM